MTGYEENKLTIKRALALGLDVEKDDPNMSDSVPELTEKQLDWIASWLASENIGKIK